MAVVAHVHLSGFYASVERLIDRELRSVPVLVCSPSGLSRSSVVLDVSEDARCVGVRPGIPVQQALRICQSARTVVYSPDRYEEHARAVLELCSSFSPFVEPIYSHSVFLDLSFSDDPDASGSSLVSELDALGHNARLGIASSKLTARAITMYLEARRCPKRVYWCRNDTAFLQSLPVSYLWPLDRSTLEKLRRLGIARVGDLAVVPEAELVRQFGQLGTQIYLYSIGIDRSRVRALYPPPSVREHISVEYEIAERSAVEAQIGRLSERVSRRLRMEGTSCRRLSLGIMLCTGERVVESSVLAVPVSSRAGVLGAALRALGRMNLRAPVVEISLEACDLETSVGKQLALLDGLGDARQKLLAQAVHSVRERFGKEAIRFASTVSVSRRELFLEKLMASWC
ncbi:MAG: DNA polymerase Y family protein [Armatimonadota bacterium]